MAVSAELSPTFRVPLAGVLAWLVPGLGHLFLGYKVRGLVCLITIALTFWVGVAIGGLRDTVDPHSRKYWFMAQVCSGVHSVAAYKLGQPMRADKNSLEGRAHWLSADTGVVYTGVAGLLNLLVILDALTRADVTVRREQAVGSPGT